MAISKCVEALKQKLEELKGVSDVLWESLNCQVGNLEAKMDAHGSGSSKAP